MRTVLNSFGDAAGGVDKVADVMFATIKAGKTTASELAASIGQVSPVAASAGVTLEAMSAAMATLTASGLNTAETSTALKATIVGILKPSESAKRALDRIGVTTDSLADKERGLGDAIARVKKAVDAGNGALVDFFPNVRALVGVSTLAGTGFDKFNESLEATRNASGAAGEAFGKVASTLTFAWQTAWQTVKDAFRSFGQALAPIATAVVSAFTDMGSRARGAMQAFADWMGKRGAAIKEAIGTILGAVGATFTEFLDALGFSFGDAGSSFDGFLKMIRDNKERIVGYGKEIGRVAAYIVRSFVGFGERIWEFIKPAIDGFKALLKSTGAFRSTISQKFAGVAVVFESLYLGAKVSFQGIAAALAYVVEKALWWRSITIKVLAAVLRKFAAFGKKMASVLAGVATYFARFGDTIKLGLKTAVLGWVLVIERGMQKLVDAARALGAPTATLQRALDALKDTGDGLFSDLQKDAASLNATFEKMEAAIGSGFDSLAKVADGIEDAGDLHERWRQIAQETFEILKRDTKATAAELADVEGRYVKILEALGKISKATKEQAETEKTINDRMRTRVRLRKQLEKKKPTRSRRSRRRRGGGPRGFLQLGIVRGQKGAGFPGLTGAAGQMGTVGARAGQGGGSGRFGGMVTGPDGRRRPGGGGGGGGGQQDAMAQLVALFQKFKELAQATAKDPEVSGAFKALGDKVKDLAGKMGTDAFEPAFLRLKEKINAQMAGLVDPEKFTKLIVEMQNKMEGLGATIKDGALAEQFGEIQKRFEDLGNATGAEAQAKFQRLAEQMTALAAKAEDPLKEKFTKLAQGMEQAAKKAGEAGLAGELGKASKAMDALKASAENAAAGMSSAASSMGGQRGGRYSQGRRSITGRAISNSGQVANHHAGGFLKRTGPFIGQRGEFVIRRRIAQAIGPAALRRLGRGTTVNNTINASDRSTMGSRSQIRAMLPELRRQTKLGVRQGGPF